MRAGSFVLGVTQLDVGAAAKPPARAVLAPYKGCFRADYRPPLHTYTKGTRLGRLGTKVGLVRNISASQFNLTLPSAASADT